MSASGMPGLLWKQQPHEENQRSRTVRTVRLPGGGPRLGHCCDTIPRKGEPRWVERVICLKKCVCNTLFVQPANSSRV